MTEAASFSEESSLAPVSGKGARWPKGEPFMSLVPAPWTVVASLPVDLHVAVLSREGDVIASGIVSLVEPERSPGRDTEVWADLNKRAGTAKLVVRWVPGGAAASGVAGAGVWARLRCAHRSSDVLHSVSKPDVTSKAEQPLVLKLRKAIAAKLRAGERPRDLRMGDVFKRCVCCEAVRIVGQH